MNSRSRKQVAFRSPDMRRTLTAIGSASLMLLLTGCANVQPWQRGALVDYSMRPEWDQVDTGLAEHMWFSREAATGGRGVGGGGCGCN